MAEILRENLGTDEKFMLCFLSLPLFAIVEKVVHTTPTQKENNRSSVLHAYSSASYRYETEKNYITQMIIESNSGNMKMQRYAHKKHTNTFHV